MNYITLINQFWVLHKEHSFTANETALYFGILDICNELRWKNPFSQSNARFCSKLGLSEPTFLRARNALKQNGLINFKSEVGRRHSTVYEIKYQKNFSIYEGISESISESISVSISEGNCSEKAFDYNKHKTKLKKTKLTNDKSLVIAAPENLADFFKAEEEETFERKKSSAKKKKADTSSFASMSESVQASKDKAKLGKVSGATASIPYGLAMERQWLSFYRSKFGFKPTYGKTQALSLDAIIKGLKQRSVDTKAKWTKGLAFEWFEDFLNRAYADKWLGTHFLLSNLERQFDLILNNESPSGTNNAANTAQRKTTNNTAATGNLGGTIAELQALKRSGTTDTS